MSDLSGFDANAVEPSKGFGLIPRGDYDAVIVDSDKKTTQAGDGSYLEFQFQFLSGEYQNRRLFHKLNLWNKSAEAVQISKGELSAICRAVGIMTPKDSNELHNKPLKISVAIKKNKKSGEDENRIVGFKARNAGPSGPASQAQTTRETNATAAATAPW